MDVSKPLPDKVPDNITYQVQIQNTVIVIHDAPIEKPAIIDITGIITGLVVNLIMLLIGMYIRKNEK